MQFRSATGQIVDVADPSQLGSGTWTLVTNGGQNCGCNPCPPGSGLQPAPTVTQTGCVVQAQPVCNYPQGQPITVTIRPCGYPVFVTCDGILVSTHPMEGTIYCDEGTWTAVKSGACPDVLSNLYVEDPTSKTPGFWYFDANAGVWFHWDTGAWVQSTLAPVCVSPVYYIAIADTFHTYVAPTEQSMRQLVTQTICVSD